MNPRFSTKPPGWLIAVLLAAVFILWAGVRRSARINEASSLGAGVAAEANTPTGYARGVRHQLVPDHHLAGYQWVMQAQAAAADGDWRLREIDYDNAPQGRLTHLAAPYRWWLELVAQVTGLATDRSPGRAAEFGALAAGPALQLLALSVLAALAAARFGPWSGALVAVGLVALFPLGGAFLPGQPDDAGLRVAVALGSLLLLLAGLRASTPDQRRWLVAAGVVGGIGCWINVASQLAVTGGVLLAAALAGWRQRRTSSLPETPPPWRSWALAGAATSLVAWLFEYAGTPLRPLQLAANHPLHALAWVGAAELVHRVWTRNDAAPARRGRVTLALSVAAVVLLPLALAFGDGRLFPGAAGAPNQLTGLGGGISAASIAAWVARDGAGTAFWATVLPLGVIVPALLLLRRGSVGATNRLCVAIALGPVVVLLVLGCFQLHWWILLGAAVLALAATIIAGSNESRLRLAVAAIIGVSAIPGLLQMTPRPPAAGSTEVSASELEGLVARDLAHWLAVRAGEPGAVVLAPPQLTPALAYYGGLRGISTPYWENAEGFAAATRIVGATSMDEAQALAQRREVRFVVLPSWDQTLADLARLGAEDKFDQSLAGLLQRWHPPRWLRPLPYQLPGIAGLESRVAIVYEVVEPQDNATALGRLAEYFLEMGQAHLAASVADALRQSFATDLSALAARAHVDLSRRDAAALQATLSAIDTALARRQDEIIPWERRISLVLALAQARRMDQARTMAAAGLAQADPPLLRSLTPGTLFRLLLFCRAVQLELPDPALRAAALELLPAEWRARL